MTSATSKFVTSFDVIVVVGACLFGVVCGIVGLRHTKELNEKLREVSGELSSVLLSCAWLHGDYTRDWRDD